MSGEAPRARGRISGHPPTFTECAWRAPSLQTVRQDVAIARFVFRMPDAAFGRTVESGRRRSASRKVVVEVEPAMSEFTKRRPRGFEPVELELLEGVAAQLPPRQRGVLIRRVAAMRAQIEYATEGDVLRALALVLRAMAS